MLQSKTSFLVHIKSSAMKAERTSSKKHRINFFSDLEDKKYRISREFKKLDDDKKLDTGPYQPIDKKPFDDSFKNLDVDDIGKYSRMTSTPFSSLRKKIEEKNLIHEAIRFKIDEIILINEKRLKEYKIFDIERKVDSLII